MPALYARLADWPRTLAGGAFPPVLQVLACRLHSDARRASSRGGRWEATAAEPACHVPPKVPRGRPRTLTSSQSRRCRLSSQLPLRRGDAQSRDGAVAAADLVAYVTERRGCFIGLMEAVEVEVEVEGVGGPQRAAL